MAGSTPASPTAEPGAVLRKPVASISPWAEAWRRFKRHRLAYCSLWLLGALVLAVLLGPLFYKVGINEIDFQARLAGPALTHPLGTDDLGPRPPGAHALRRAHLAGRGPGGDADGHHAWACSSAPSPASRAAGSTPR